MNWISALNNALEYIENNLENDVKNKKNKLRYVYVRNIMYKGFSR